MKKIIRLTELDLARIVRRVIKEQDQQPSIQGKSVTNAEPQPPPKITDPNKIQTYLNWNRSGQLSDGINILKSNGAQIDNTSLDPKIVGQDVSVVGRHLNIWIQELLKVANQYQKDIIQMMSKNADPSILIKPFQNKKIDNQTSITFGGFYNSYLSGIKGFWRSIGSIQTIQRNEAMRS